MKALFAILLTVAILRIFTVANVCAQIVAIGHVSAEIVESVSASSQAVTGFKLKNANLKSVALQPKQDSWNYENVDMGKFKINSGSDITCNVMIKSAALSDASGNEFILETYATASRQTDTQRTDGNQIIQLKGKARLIQGQVSGLYLGSYTMVFAYN